MTARRALVGSGTTAKTEGELDTRVSRLVLSGAAIGTIVGNGRADLNHTHAFKPDERLAPDSEAPHCMALWRPGPPVDESYVAAKNAALLPTVGCAPFIALATSGTAVEDEPGSPSPRRRGARQPCPSDIDTHRFHPRLRLPPPPSLLAGQGANDADRVSFRVLEPRPLASIREQCWLTPFPTVRPTRPSFAPRNWESAAWSPTFSM